MNQVLYARHAESDQNLWMNNTIQGFPHQNGVPVEHNSGSERFHEKKYL